MIAKEEELTYSGIPTDRNELPLKKINILIPKIRKSNASDDTNA